MRALLLLLLFSCGPLRVSYADDTPPSAGERCIDEACFPATTVLGDHTLPLQGVAKLTYFGFRVYAAALYAAPGDSSLTKILSPVPKRLVIHYFRAFTPEDFIQGKLKLWEDNPQVDIEKITPSRRVFDTFYKPVTPGSRYTIDFEPKRGTSLTLDGKYLGTVNDDSYASAYFSLWLSEYSVDKDFTRQLLGGS